MFLIVENLAGLYIASRSVELSNRWLIKIVSPYVATFSGPALYRHGLVIVLSRRLIRILKPLLSLLQIPIIQQDPMSLAFRLNAWKRILSDGLLTEYLVRELKLPVRRFYSLSDLSGGNAPCVSGCAIIGSNWLEFGSMGEQSYLHHLQFLKQRYPDAIYYCHPRELNRLPDQVFGAKQVCRPHVPVEVLLQAQGVPRQLVGVCSSSLLGLAAGNADQIRVDLVSLPASRFDGPRCNTIEDLKTPVNGSARITIGELQAFLRRALAEQRVDVRLVIDGPQPDRS